MTIPTQGNNTALQAQESPNSAIRDEALHVMLLALINAAGYGHIDGWFAIRARELIAEMERRGMA